MNKQPRSISSIAFEIFQLQHQWPQGKISIPALVYLKPMMQIDKITDMYGCDHASSVVAYFLSNATIWKGEDARRIKAELNAMLKSAR